MPDPVKKTSNSGRSPFKKMLEAVCKSCSASTVYVYTRNVLRLVKLTNPDATSVPDSPGFLSKKETLDAFDKLDLNKRRLLATAAVKALDAFKIDRTKAWSTRLADAAAEYETKRESRERTPSETAKWPAKGGYDALKRAAKQQKMQILHTLKKKEKTVRDLWEIQKWLILVLYGSHAVRLDFGDVYLEKPSDNTKNYMYKYRRKGWILTLNTYKTAKFRGATEIKMSRPASLALSTYIPLSKALTTHGKLLSNIRGEALTRNGLSKLLTRLTEKLLGRKGFSASLIRVLKATKFRSALEKSKSLADEMMHTQKQNFQYSRK